jgi:hypothetical protein
MNAAQPESKTVHLETVAKLVALANCMREVIDAATLLIEEGQEEDARRILDAGLKRWRRPPGGWAGP